MRSNHIGLMKGAGEIYRYKIPYSCRFNPDDSARLTYAPGTGEDAQTMTFSFWLRRLETGVEHGLIHANGDTNNNSTIQIIDTDVLRFRHRQSGSTIDDVRTSAVLRDVSAWYHIVVAIDTDQATASDRVKFYINGELVTNFSSTNYPASGQGLDFGQNYTRSIGRCLTSGSYKYLDGYLAEVHYIMGQQLTADDFGEWNKGIWTPKKYTGSYGTTGSYHDFADAADLGNDVSGNNNDWTSTNLTTADQFVTSPTNNACLMNFNKTYQGISLENGSRTIYSPGAAAGETSFSAMEIPAGMKVYFEQYVQSNNTGPNYLGVIDAETYYNHRADSTAVLSESRLINVRIDGGGAVWDGTSWSSSYGDFDYLDNIGVALDGAGKMWFSINGTWVNSGDPAAGTGAVLTNVQEKDLLVIWSHNSSNNNRRIMRFGENGYALTAPSGFVQLFAENLPEPDIIESSKGFDVITYSGDSSNPRNITGLDFAPDLVWLKARTTAQNHMLVDSVRGAQSGAGHLFSDSTSIEGNNSAGEITALLTNGFTVDAGSSSANAVNLTGQDYVAWCLRKGAKYGFDIVTYAGDGVAGRTVSHSLGGVPELIIVKRLNVSANWAVYHHHALTKTDPETDYALLNLTNVFSDNVVMWNDTAPTATVFSVGTSLTTNASGSNYVAYLFRSIPGFSKVFSYQGNGNADGPYVYLGGLRPKFVMIKNFSTGEWGMYDDVRKSYNPVDAVLTADATTTEAGFGAANRNIDFYANGFKIRTTASGGTTALNTSGAKYCGIAFAAQPYKYANAR